MSIILDFLISICVGVIGLIAIFAFVYLITYGMGVFLDFITKYKVVRKVCDIGIKIIYVVILIIYVVILIILCYWIGFSILEKFL